VLQWKVKEEVKRETIVERSLSSRREKRFEDLFEHEGVFVGLPVG